MIKISANLSKKVPLPGVDYSSQQFGAAMEIEISDTDRPDAIKQRIQEVYALLSQTVDEQITVGPYTPTNPLTTVKAQKLFDSAVEDARHVTTIRGYVLGRSVGGQHDAETPFACLTGPGDRITVVDGHRALLVQTVTGANIVKVLADPRSPRVVFFKDDHPVAVLLAADDEKIRSLFQRMLDGDSRC